VLDERQSALRDHRSGLDARHHVIALTAASAEAGSQTLMTGRSLL
jgi:hypothetical protein